MRKSSIILLVALALGLGAAAGYWASRTLEPGDAAAPPPPVATAPAPAPRAVAIEAMSLTTTALQERLSAVGTLVSEESVMLRSEVAGRIREIRFREGQSVRQGDTLITLDDAIAQAELMQAQANFALARSKFQRASELQRQGFISAQGRDEATNTLQVERANVALAQAKLDKAAIRAPFDGEIGLRNVSPGDYINVGQDLVTLQAIRQLKVDFRIPEVFLARITPGQRLNITLDALPGRSWQAEVAAISPLVDIAGRALVMRAVVDNSDGTLRPGMFARVNVLLSEADALMVPETALLPRGGGQYVYRVVDGRAQEVPVQVGTRRDAMVAITGDLAVGDQIVTAGLQKIQDGSPVTVTLQPAI